MDLLILDFLLIVIQLVEIKNGILAWVTALAQAALLASSSFVLFDELVLDQRHSRVL